MVFRSPHPALKIPQTHILDFLFPSGDTPWKRPIWIDATDPAKSLTLKDSLDCIRRLGLGLQNRGVEENDVAVLFTPNHIFVPVAYLGFIAAGAVFSGVDPESSLTDVVERFQLLDPKFIFVHPSLLKTAVAAVNQAGLSEDRIYVFSDSPGTAAEEFNSWRSILATEEEAASWKWNPVSAHEAGSTTAVVNFTSGTTTQPKGVQLTHQNLIASSLQLRDGTDIMFGDRLLALLPLSQAYEQVLNVILAIKLRLVVYILPSFALPTALSTIQRYRITKLHLSPYILESLTTAREVAGHELRSVDVILCTGPPLKMGVQNAAERRFGVVILQGWGMSEITTAGIFPCLEDDIAGRKSLGLRGSVGRLLPNTEALLIDQNGNEVSIPGALGEIWIRGPQVMSCYWRDEQVPEDSLAAEGGWFMTGDIATVNRDGYFWIIDRKDELIRVDDVLVSPAELEMVLQEHPRVADVAVVGMTMHEDVLLRAYIVPKPAMNGYPVTEQLIQDWMRRRVTKNKQLRGGVAFVKKLPRLSNRGVARRVAREWAQEDGEILERRVAKL
ncbi:hypothetical protein BP5796_03041 [Coleophoma crateriformis]|uniref:Acetyl-CoA synthetase-like protein n=1 Tax=Coleophoma crateriformis TaxID=565419 RepID=A0A3D8SM02_9HELO|nr:hypothetical protein BP5796_03041 [Coleophoma crateriformis]